jgi:hypothetical protein
VLILKSGNGHWSSPGCARSAALLGALAFLFSPAPAIAGGPLAAQGEPIATSDYALDLFQGPLFAGTRLTSLAGAYVAIAEDVDGDLQNPASPAVRPFFSYSHFDYWIGFGVTFPADLSSMDFFNSGSKTNVPNPPDSFVFFTPALNLQWGEFGIGLNFSIQQYALADPEEGQRRGITATIPTTHLQLAHGFANNQLVAGVGVRYITMTVNAPDESGFLFRSSGPGFEFGVVYKPENVPLRVGIAYRTPIVTQAYYSEKLLPNANGDLIIERSDGSNLYLPKAVASPWDLNVGFATQFGERPINHRWRTDKGLIEQQTLERRLRGIAREKARDQALASAKTSAERTAITQRFEKEEAADDRTVEIELLKMKTLIEKKLAEMNTFYFQIAASVVISGAVDQAVGVESLVNQTVNRSGEYVVVSPRLGVEMPIFPTWLKIRGGSYLEPTRFKSSSLRMHGTFGIDLKLAVWNVFGLWPDNYMWRLGLGGDLSREYFTWGLTIAGWYPRHTDADTVPNFAAPLEAQIPNP